MRMDLRDKDIAFFLDLEIPSDSEVSFCASDDDEDDINLVSNNTVPESLDDIDEMLMTSDEIDQFQKEIQEELRILDKDATSHNTPYSFLSQIFTEDIFEYIRLETIRYAIECGKVSFTLTMKELKTYFAINIAMTYIRYSNVRMYWSSLPGIRMNMIADAMNVNRFGEIK